MLIDSCERERNLAILVNLYMMSNPVLPVELSIAVEGSFSSDTF